MVLLRHTLVVIAWVIMRISDLHKMALSKELILGQYFLLLFFGTTFSSPISYAKDCLAMSPSVNKF